MKSVNNFSKEIKKDLKETKEKSTETITIRVTSEEKKRFELPRRWMGSWQLLLHRWRSENDAPPEHNLFVSVGDTFFVPK